MAIKLRELLRHKPKGSPEEALEALHQRVEIAKQYRIKKAEQEVGVEGYSKDGDTSGYLSPHNYEEVEELPVE